MSNSNPSEPDSINRLTDILSHLVRMPTVTEDHATNLAALDWIEAQLQDLPLTISRYEHNGFPSLVATTSQVADPKNPKLWLVGHVDVVPGELPTFQPRVSGGRLYGRGVHDMKFALACFIVLLQELGQDLKYYDLGLMLTSDEETGGYSGVKWLIEKHGYRGEAVIIPDSGASWKMETGSKGVMWWELIAQGRTAHASRPWEGTNAIDELNKFIELIRANVTSEPCGDPIHNHPTLNYSTISAEGATNQVPAHARATLDIRVTPEVGLDAVYGWISQAQAIMPHIKASTLTADHPYQVKHNGPVHAFQKIVQDVTGHDVNLAIAHGSSDARHFARHDISTINVIPTGSGSHHPDEWVDIADLGRFYQIVKQFTTQWSKSS